MIFTSLSPNATKRDIAISMAYLFLPWRWKSWYEGEYVERLQENLKDTYDVPYAFTFGNARSALFLALRALGVGEGDQVLIQPLTCIVVPNAVQWNGAIPVYVDVDKTLNMDPSMLEKKITAKTKAIIVQHSFGMPANMDAILKIAARHHLPIIEDCAVSMGAELHGKKIGTLGDVGIFSFGRDKILSSVEGGALITKNPHITKKIDDECKRLRRMTVFRLFQNLLHAPLYEAILLTYDWKLGKAIHALVKKIGLVNKVYSDEESVGAMPQTVPTSIPNALAHIACEQLKNLDAQKMHRKEIYQVYRKALAAFDFPADTPDSDPGFLRAVILTPHAKDIRSKMLRAGISLGNWYESVIVPLRGDFQKSGYAIGSCPMAEKYAGHMINLPTSGRITTSMAMRIVEELKKSNL